MNNSATNHLLKIVIAARDLRVNASFVEGWKRIFGEAETLEIHRKIGLLYRLIDAAAQEVLAADPDQSEAINHWKSQLYTGLSAAATKNWMEFHAHIDSHTINYLRMQSTVVQLTNGGNELDYEELMRAKSLLLEAIEEIKKSELSTQAKVAVIRRLRALIAAIDDYSLTGSEEVLDQFKSGIYDFATSKEIREKGLGEKFSQAAEVLANIVTSVTGLQQLAAPTLQLLGLGK
ncbi:hypothetical protein [Xanthomonas phaseoli]|uniref:hypothetical protein n=1 Tax=Xanthomonas phaseoli TaxID=1985254 RepID=UPI001E475180|nr:hypothetical protein [Xanthomonas phaseoli]MCC8469294.1 hypothetical protein [Xanthomonas phaseoli]